MHRACAQLFEDELTRRGVSFARDVASARHVVERADGTRLLISLDNLCKEYERDKDPGRIARFVATVLGSGADIKLWSEARSQLLLALEPSDYEDRPDLARKVSDRVDQVPVLWDAEVGAITWITRQMLQDWSVTDEEVFRTGAANLDEELRKSALECQDIDEVQLGFISSHLPFKGSLILAPGLRKFAEPVLGWPLLAVIPARDFLYLWSATEKGFVYRLGGVVVREFESSPYPISREVFEVTDGGLRAIGEFPSSA